MDPHKGVTSAMSRTSINMIDAGYTRPKYTGRGGGSAMGESVMTDRSSLKHDIMMDSFDEREEDEGEGGRGSVAESSYRSLGSLVEGDYDKPSTAGTTQRGTLPGVRVQQPSTWTIEPVFATAASILEKLRDEAVKVAHVTVPEDQEMQYWYRQGVVDGVMQLLQTLHTASMQVADPIDDQAGEDSGDGVRFIEEGVLCEDRLISDIMEARRNAAMKCKKRRPREPVMAPLPSSLEPNKANPEFVARKAAKQRQVEYAEALRAQTKVDRSGTSSPRSFLPPASGAQAPPSTAGSIHSSMGTGLHVGTSASVEASEAAAVPGGPPDVIAAAIARRRGPQAGANALQSGAKRPAFGAARNSIVMPKTGKYASSAGGGGGGGGGDGGDGGGDGATNEMSLQDLEEREEEDDVAGGGEGEDSGEGDAVAALGAAAPAGPAPTRGSTGGPGGRVGAGAAGRAGTGAGAGLNGGPLGLGATPSPRMASPRVASPRVVSPRVPGRANGAGGYAAPSKPPVSRGGVSTVSSVPSERPGRRVKIVTPGSTRVVRGSVDHGTGRTLGFGA